MSVDRRRRWLVILGLIVVVAVVYEPVRDHAFVVCDDPGYVYQNPNIRLGLSAEGIAWAWTGNHGGNWHPLTTLSHLLDYELFGLDPAGHHLVNVALHAVNACLLFLGLLWMTGRLGASALVALLFAIHPIRVESVAWVSERKDVLSGTCALLCLLAYVRFSARRTMARYALVSIVFALGLLAKPMLVTLPFVLLLLDVWPLRRFPERLDATGGASRFPRRPLRDLVLEKVPWLALSIAVSVITLASQASAGAIGSTGALPLGARIAHALVSYVAYVWKSIYPGDLAVFYPHPFLIGPTAGASWWGWPEVGSGLLLAALTSAFVYFGRTRRYLIVGWLWFLGMLVPVIGIVQVGAQAMADRYAYLPFIGLHLILVFGAAEIARGSRRGRVNAGGLDPVRGHRGGESGARTDLQRLLPAERGTGEGAVAGGAEAEEARVPRSNPANDSTLNRGSAVVAAEAAGPHPRTHGRGRWIVTGLILAYAALLGMLAARQVGVWKNSLTLLGHAIAVTESNYWAHNNLGVAYEHAGELARAAVHYRRSVEIHPRHTRAQANLANVLLQRGELRAAESHVRIAIELDPTSADLQHNLGLILRRTGDLEGAAAALERAVALDPTDPVALNNLGAVHERLGQRERALASYRRSIEVRPDYAIGWANLGHALLRDGDPEEAERCLREAVRLDPDLAYARRGLDQLENTGP